MDINAAVDQRVASLIQQAMPTIIQTVMQSLGNPAQQQPVQQFQQPVQQQPVQQQPVQQFQQPVQQFQQPVQQQGQVTVDMIQALIQPLIANEQSKQAVIAAMNQCGVQNLGDARPEQLPALYQAFSAVAAQYMPQPNAQFQQPQQFQQQPVQQQQPAAGPTII